MIKTYIEKDLGHVSYILYNNGECCVIDPKRDIKCYEKFIKKNNLKLKYIILTHPHADFIAGHLELKNRYKKAKILLQKNAPAKFNFFKVKENDKFQIGNLEIKILETPGHTPFCISLLVSENGVDKYIFTGDFLFVGDIGRADLLGKENKERLLNLSFESKEKIYNLSDDIIVLTSHIEGSLCGKNLKREYISTIGIEKKTNKVFMIKNKKEYIKFLDRDIETPTFFKKMALINLEGPKFLKNLKSSKKLSFKKFIKKSKNGIIIDFRHPKCFRSNYIKGSINVYEKSNIALIIGSLIENETNLYLVGDSSTNFKKIIKRLRKIGFDNIKAILKDDVNELDLIPFKSIKAEKTLSLDKSIKADRYMQISEVKNLNENYKVVCKNGYKSMAVISFFKVKNYLKVKYV